MGEPDEPKKQQTVGDLLNNLPPGVKLPVSPAAEFRAQRLHMRATTPNNLAKKVLAAFDLLGGIQWIVENCDESPQFRLAFLNTVSKAIQQQMKLKGPGDADLLRAWADALDEENARTATRVEH